MQVLFTGNADEDEFFDLKCRLCSEIFAICNGALLEM